MTEEVKKEVEEIEEEVDEFDKAFEDAVSDKPQAPVEDPKPDETKGDPIVDDPLSKVVPPQDPPVVPVKTKEEELEEELDKQRQKTATWDGRISAANERTKKAEEELEALRQAKVEKDDDDFPDEDEEALKEFSKEFPDFIKPIITLVKKELLPIIGQMISDKLGTIEPQVTSIKKKMETDTNETHFRVITSKHKDWKQIVESGALDKWIATQPSYLATALNKVKVSGSTLEVIDMFTQYKQNTGQVPVDTDPPPTPKKEESTKAQDLLAVPASPSKITTKDLKKDKEDFDAGWNDALKEDKKV